MKFLFLLLWNHLVVGGIIISKQLITSTIIDNNNTCSITNNNSNYNRIPIILLCHKRTLLLNNTINSLLNVRGVEKSNVIAVQDGNDTVVESIIRSHDIHLHQVIYNNDKINRYGRRRNQDPSTNIARHYKKAIEYGFNKNNDSEGLIIVEDDLLFSPDFYEFLQLSLHFILNYQQDDKSIWLASAWNDNGFKGLVRDKGHIMHTNHFPGLGWVLPKHIWFEIRNTWPKKHWDWHFRNPQVSKNRVCLYPQVPRVFHAGWDGTFMNAKLHQKYFAHIDYNLDNTFKWDMENHFVQQQKNYFDRLVRILLYKGIHVRNGSILNTNLVHLRGVYFIIWHETNPDPKFKVKFKLFARKFGIWPEMQRGSLDGLQEFYYKQAKILLVNIFDDSKKRKTKKNEMPTTGKKKRKRVIWKNFAPSNNIKVFRDGGRSLLEDFN